MKKMKWFCAIISKKKSKNKTYYIPKVFANHTSLSNDDIETIISINENKLDYGWIKQSGCYNYINPINNENPL